MCQAHCAGTDVHALAVTHKCAVVTIRNILKQSARWDQLVAEGRGKCIQEHRPKKHAALYAEAKEILVVVRDAHSVVTKHMLLDYFQQTSTAFQQLAPKSKVKFWGRFKRFSAITRLRVSGCTQLVPADYNLRIANFRYEQPEKRRA
jgi:hypothetical protein